MFRQVFALLFLLCPIAAQAGWHEASTPHFTVYSDQSPEKLREFAANLERFDFTLRKLCRWEDPPQARANRLTVYVLDDRQDVAKLAGNSRVAGFYKPLAGGSMAVVPRRAGGGAITDLSDQAILLHEYAHHLMLSMAPNAVIPAWYVEGFAELFATAEFDKRGVIVGGPPQYRAQILMRGNGLPAQSLLMADTLTLSNEQREALYGRGWLLTHYLLIAQQRKGQLAAYLRDINSGKPMAEAASAFGDLALLDRELERYKGGKIARQLVSPMADPQIALRKLTAGEAATMQVRIRLKQGGSAKAAVEVYADARKRAAPYPTDPGAQIVLAEAALAARDLAAAEAAADRAIAADSQAMDAYIIKAKTRSAAARKAGDKSRETASEIRRIIAIGNKIEPDEPELLILYYRSFVNFGMAPSENAKDGLARAFELAPQDRMLRFNAARMFLRDGHPATARAMLAPLAYSPHAPALARRAAKLIARIDARDTEGAIKGLDDQPPAENEGAEVPPSPPAT